MISAILPRRIACAKGCEIMVVFDWLTKLSDWLQSGDRANMVFVVLAFALLLELCLRVIRRAFSDRQAVRAAAQNIHRVNARLGRAPLP